MKKVLLLILLQLPLMAIETYQIDPAASQFTFTIDNRSPGKKTVEAVSGKFKSFSGTIQFDNQDPSQSKVEITVQSGSIDTGNEKRDKHLKNADFFDINKHPTLTFKSTQVEKIDDKSYRVTGDFTLIGATKPVTADVTLTSEKEAKVEFTLSRSDFGMSYRVPETADLVKVRLLVKATP